TRTLTRWLRGDDMCHDVMRSGDDCHPSRARLDVAEHGMTLQLTQRREGQRPVVVDVPRTTRDEPRSRRREEDEERAPVRRRADLAFEQLADGTECALGADRTERRGG